MRYILSLTLIVVTLLPLPSLAEQEGGPIKIGSILFLTGEGANWGNASKNGIELAVKDLNARGGLLGRAVEAVHQNDEGDPKKAISAFRQLTDIHGIDIIIGTTWSNSGIALSSLAIREKVLMISPSLGLAEFNESSPLLFNLWPHDHILSKQLADHVFAEGYRSVALVGAQEVWVTQQTKFFKEYSGMSGDLVADGKGGFVKPSVLKKVVEGKPVTVAR